MFGAGGCAESGVALGAGKSDDTTCGFEDANHSD